jgi:hypothetical protein
MEFKPVIKFAEQPDSKLTLFHAGKLSARTVAPFHFSQLRRDQKVKLSSANLVTRLPALPFLLLSYHRKHSF